MSRNAILGPSGTIAVWLLLAATLMTQSGCRTAASMGLPISAGGHSLLSYAKDLRQSAGHPNGVPTELAKLTLPAHRVEAGDVLVIEPNDFNSPVRLSADQTVQQDGTIELGSYGRLTVAGMSAEEIQSRVQNVVTAQESEKRLHRIALASHRDGGSDDDGQDDNVDYGVTVRLVNKESGLFYVMGEVNAPGSYPLVGHETVLDAIIAAGGLSDRSNDHKIILTRPQTASNPRQIMPVCYQQILQLGDVSTNYQLMPGDRIYVPSLTLWEDVKQSVSWGNEKSCPHCREYKSK
ncbi:polysaccharide biosynthesis/export family protein [Rubripirellula lacrimiformis]|uniref:polysaccharide biosynthesis/export family protein n=1 Tax=Rubripirellula lacrimiformis TaxID=1930273 RepID=UPI001C54EF26|nr:polysaccharide biosynthesis/export family protein [Rubripirellula lacrimiformis]